MPIDAIMATRPCLISAERMELKDASVLEKPRGSKKPSGAVAPICLEASKADLCTARLPLATSARFPPMMPEPRDPQDPKLGSGLPVAEPRSAGLLAIW